MIFDVPFFVKCLSAGSTRYSDAKSRDISVVRLETPELVVVVYLVVDSKILRMTEGKKA